MNELKLFNNPKFGEVRVIEKGGEPWFVAKDVAEILGYSDTQAMTRRLDNDETMTDKLSGMNMSSTFINESGLYNAIIGSQKPEAKMFKKWVTSEVLPSIRKHGAYMTELTIEKIIADPRSIAVLLNNLADERDRRKQAEDRNAILMHVNKTYTVTEIAKEAGMKSAIELNNFLCEQHLQFLSNKTWVPYSHYAQKGYFSIKQEVLDSGRVIYHRRITQIGREFILNLVRNKLMEE
jgi:prophage antirepressor-like protein